MITFPVVGSPRPTKLGRYELITELGRGGMAQLYLGRLAGLGGFSKLVAIKHILPHLSSDRRFVDMFVNEGRIAARLAHPNICQVFELGEDRDHLYLVMEYLAGVTWEQLAGVLDRSDPYRIMRVVAGVIAQTCNGLHYAHDHHVIHRDVSPQNLFVTIDGTCKLLDFGVSRVRTDDRTTRSGIVKGKLAYMPPEQIRGEDVDARADVFALGVVVWEGLTGGRLYERSTDFQVWRAIMEDDPPALAAARPEFAELDPIVRRALARNRDERFATVNEFGDALVETASRRWGVATTAELAALVRGTCAATLAEREQLIARLEAVDPSGHPIDDAEADAGDTLLDSRSPGDSLELRGASVAIDDSPSRRRSRRRVWIGIGAVAACVAAIAIAIGWPTSDPDRPRLARRPAQVSDPPRGTPTPPTPTPTPTPTPAPTPAPAPVTANKPAGLAKATRPAPRSTAANPTTAPAPPPPPPTTAKLGFYTVDSTPYATIYIDGARRDQTPVFRMSLAAGKHAVRAVLADGRERTFEITIVGGEEVTGRLAW